MRPRFLPTILCFLLWVPLCASTGLGAGGAELTRATLKNGLRVVIIQDPLAPVASVQMNYLVGSNEAPDGFPGMAHAQEHMMFRGSPGLTAGQLANLIAALGGEFNADTQQTVTQYFCTVPPEDLELALHIEAVRMAGVLDSQSLWEEERGAIEQEVAQDLSNPMYVFYARLLSEMYSGTPYAHDALGTRPSFDRTTGAMLKSFHDTWYVPNNAILVIAGDVDPAATLNAAQRLFEPIPSRPLPARPVIRLQPLKPSAIALETDLSYGLSVVSYRMPGYQSPDFAAAQVLADVLDSQRGDLYALVPEGRALFTEFSFDPLPEAGLATATAAFPQGSDGSALAASIKGVVAGYVKQGLPQDLVEATKKRKVAEAEFRKNSVPGLASEWSQALALEGRESPDEDVEAIRRVSVEDVNRVASQYLVNDTAVVAVLTPRPSGKPVTAKSFRGKESFAPKQTGSVELPEWAQKALAAPTLPPSVVKPSDLHLPNGLRLIVQPVSISPTVSVYGQVKNKPDLEQPSGKEGVSEVLDGLFSYGTTTLDRLAFQAQVDGIAADLTVGTDFSLQVLSEHFDRGMELLCDNLLHPALPADAFRVVQEETSSAVAGRLKSPSYLSRRALRKGLYPHGDPSLRQATPQTVGKLTLDDVKSYYGKVFRPDLTTVVVIGQVTEQQARAVVEKYLGGWKAEGPRPETELPPVPPSKPSSSVVPDPSRVQDAVTLAQTLDLTRQDPAYYTLEVGNHVLSGAFYATRLYRDLREKAGLVYTVGSFLQAGKTRSIFGVFYACDPPNVSRAKGMVERDLRDMQTALVSPSELQQAKTLLMRQIPLSEASTDDIAQGLLFRSVEGLPLDEPTRAARRYLEVSAEELRAAFAKYLRPEGFVQVTLGPAPQ